MGKFIEEFYYGNLDPQARSTKQNKAVQKKMEVLMLNEDYLTENLSGESKKKFLEFVNAWGVVNGEYSRFRYLEAFREHSTYSSTQFLKHVVEKFPYAIDCVQTDNGFEFTNEMGNSKKKPLTLFEKTLTQLGIRHKKIRAFTPRHNGKVERSHRKDNEYFYADHKFYSFEDFAKQLAVHQRKYK